MDAWIIAACRVPYPPIPPSNAQVQVVRLLVWVGLGRHMVADLAHMPYQWKVRGHSQVEGGIRVRGCMNESGAVFGAS